VKKELAKERYQVAFKGSTRDRLVIVSASVSFEALSERKSAKPPGDPSRSYSYFVILDVFQCEDLERRERDPWTGPPPPGEFNCRLGVSANRIGTLYDDPKDKIATFDEFAFHLRQVVLDELYAAIN
jgi:hypothetical protein